MIAWYGVASIRERCGLNRVEPEERQQQPRGDEHELGHAAVETEATSVGAHLHLAEAVILLWDAARRAASAAPRSVDRDGLADLESADPYAQALHPAGVLVAKGEGQGVRECASGHSIR